jgi:hypothetical protein
MGKGKGECCRIILYTSRYVVDTPGSGSEVGIQFSSQIKERESISEGVGG